MLPSARTLSPTQFSYPYSPTSMKDPTNSQAKKSNAGTSTPSKDSHVLPEDIAKAIAYLEYRRLRHKHPHV